MCISLSATLRDITVSTCTTHFEHVVTDKNIISQNASHLGTHKCEVCRLPAVSCLLATFFTLPYSVRSWLLVMSKWRRHGRLLARNCRKPTNFTFMCNLALQIILANTKRAGDVTHIRKEPIMEAESKEGQDAEVEVQLLTK
jgi:hypothetical protein